MLRSIPRIVQHWEIIFIEIDRDSIACEGLVSSSMERRDEENVVILLQLVFVSALQFPVGVIDQY